MTALRDALIMTVAAMLAPLTLLAVALWARFGKKDH